MDNGVRIKETSQKHPRKHPQTQQPFKNNLKENNIDVKHPPFVDHFPRDYILIYPGVV